MLYAHHQITRVKRDLYTRMRLFVVAPPPPASLSNADRAKGSLLMINRTLSGRKRIVNRLRMPATNHLTFSFLVAALFFCLRSIYGSIYIIMVFVFPLLSGSVSKLITLLNRTAYWAVETTLNVSKSSNFSPLLP